MIPCDQVSVKQDLRECLYVDDVDQTEKEGQPVLHSGHVGQQAALRKYLYHWEEIHSMTNVSQRKPVSMLETLKQTLHRCLPLTSSVWLSKRSNERTMHRTNMFESTKELLI